jgi:hypothetical protein
MTQVKTLIKAALTILASPEPPPQPDHYSHFSEGDRYTEYKGHVWHYAGGKLGSPKWELVNCCLCETRGKKVPATKSRSTGVIPTRPAKYNGKIFYVCDQDLAKIKQNGLSREEFEAIRDLLKWH